MDNGVGTYDVGTLAGLRGIGFGGYGYGYSGNGNFLGDGSAVKEAVRGNRDLDLVETVNRTNADQFISDRITSGDQALANQISMNNQFLTDRIAALGMDSKFQNISNQFASLERTIIANDQRQTAAQHALDLKLTECCCELKAGQATIIANQEAARLADAQTENQNLRTQIMINAQSQAVATP